MKKAIAIKMKPGCGESNALTEIDMIKISGGWDGWHKKADVHDRVQWDTICVNIAPYPELCPATSANGEKYVRSEPNDSTHDNLLRLPRE